jgi:hypothetical protein
MIVIRCTRKLLDRVGPPVPDPPPSTTLLGDWYAKPFGIAQRRYIILASALSRIAVLMPGRDVANLARNFPEALSAQLLRLGVAAEAAAREVEACRDAAIAATADRSLLGTLNDYAAMTKFQFAGGRPLDLETQALSLSHTPLAPLGYAYPADVARQLFGVTAGRRRGPS